MRRFVEATPKMKELLGEAAASEECYVYGIHEVYYDEEGKPSKWSSEAIRLESADANGGLAWVAEKVAVALQSPTLDFETGQVVDG